MGLASATEGKCKVNPKKLLLGTFEEEKTSEEIKRAYVSSWFCWGFESDFRYDIVDDKVT